MASPSQFTRAIEAAKLTNRSGLYVIRPRWARRQLLLKLGLTKNVTTRMYSSYRHSIPYEAGSFELLAFLRVGESQLFPRERAMLQATISGYGFAKPPLDKEWRVFAGDRQQLTQSLVKLFETIRTTVDGNFYIFHPETGEIVYRGGKSPSVQVANILPPVPNVLTRSAVAAGMRKTPGVLVANQFGQMVPLVPGTNRRLRNLKPK
jgi:hypothetical protein